MWVCYKVLLKACAPIHIGYGAKLGIVDKTRYYIPAKNIWGALTNLITKSAMNNGSPKLYFKIGEELRRNMKFSYFYPAEYREVDDEEIEVKQVFAPLYTENGLRFGIRKDEKQVDLMEFERIFISSLVSTAIDKSSRSAEEGSLHEIEFIKDKIKFKQDKGPKPAVFIGYFFTKSNPLKVNLSNGLSVEILFERDSIKINGTSLDEIWVGGERNYGFGKLKIRKLSEEIPKDGKIDLFNSGIKVDMTKEQLTVLGEGNWIIALSHVNVEGLDIEFIRGDIEPLVGREWSEKGSGQRVSQKAKICIAPGSQFKCRNSIYMGDFGIWESKPNFHY